MSEMNVKDIVQNDNSRAVYHPEELNQLMGSMQEHGLLEPIGVRKTGKGKYEVIFGNRRLMAAQKLGWATIPAIVVTADDKQAQLYNLIENLQRKDLTSGEEGRSFLKLREMGLTDSEIAARLGVSLSRVKNSIAIYQAVPLEIQKKVVPTIQGSKKGTVTAKTAVFITDLVRSHSLPRAKANELYEKSMQDGFSAKNVQLVSKLLGEGFDVDEAIEQSEAAKSVGINVMIDKYHAQRLEKKYNKGIANIIYQKLFADPELKLLHNKKTRKKELVKARDSAKKLRSVRASA
jgi:ParB/RepB/Spo0J family partition protein